MEAHEMNGQNLIEAPPAQRLAEAREAIGNNLLSMVLVMAQRFEITRQVVGPIKKEYGLPAVDEARELQLQAKAEALGQEHGLPAGLMGDVTKLVISYVVEEHLELIEGQRE